MAAAPPDNAPPFGFVVQRDMLLRACLDQRLTLGNLRVYACLLSHADRQTGKAWPSLPTIAKKTGCGLRSVVRAVAELESYGLLSKSLAPNGSTRSNRYTLHSAMDGHNAMDGQHANDGQHAKSCNSTVPPMADKQVLKKQQVSKDRREQKKQATRKRNQIAVELPEWLDVEIWKQWTDYRSQRKKPLTLAGAELQLRDLAKFRDDGHDARKIIERSIANGWQGLFPDDRGSTTRADGATPAIKAVGAIQRDPRTDDEIARSNLAEALRHGVLTESEYHEALNL